MPRQYTVPPEIRLFPRRKALSKGGRPEFSTVLKVINALGLKLKIAA